MGEIVKIKKSSKNRNLQNFGEKIKKTSYTQGPSCEPLGYMAGSGSKVAPMIECIRNNLQQQLIYLQ